MCFQVLMQTSFCLHSQSNPNASSSTIIFEFGNYLHLSNSRLPAASGLNFVQIFVAAGFNHYHAKAIAKKTGTSRTHQQSSYNVVATSNDRALLDYRWHRFATFEYEKSWLWREMFVDDQDCSCSLNVKIPNLPNNAPTRIAASLRDPDWTRQNPLHIRLQTSSAA